MSVETILARARARTEALRMTETVKVGPFSEEPDLETLATVRQFLSETYAGIGQIKYPSATVSEATAGGQQVATADVLLKVPVGSAPGIRSNQMVRVIASTADGSLVNRDFRVKAWPQSGQVSAHRYPLEELS